MTGEFVVMDVSVTVEVTVVDASGVVDKLEEVTMAVEVSVVAGVVPAVTVSMLAVRVTVVMTKLSTEPLHVTDAGQL